jgi:hypothetical protein
MQSEFRAMQQPRVQFRLVLLLGSIALVAFAFAALKNPTQFRVSVVLTLTILALLSTTLQARFAPSPAARAWSFGFSLFGWSCLILAGSGWRDWLPTTIVVDGLAQLLTIHFGPYPTPNGRGTWYTNAIHDANGQFMVGAFHLIELYLALLMAMAGGILTQAVAARLATRSSTRDERETAVLASDKDQLNNPCS